MIFKDISCDPEDILQTGISSDESALRKRFQRLRRGAPEPWSIDYVVLSTKEEKEEASEDSEGLLIADLKYASKITVAFAGFHHHLRRLWEDDQEQRLVYIKGSRVLEDTYEKKGSYTDQRQRILHFHELVLAAHEDISRLLRIISRYGKVREDIARTEFSCCQFPDRFQQLTRHAVPGRIVREYILGLEQQQPFEAFVREGSYRIHGRRSKMHELQDLIFAYEIKTPDQHTAYMHKDGKSPIEIKGMPIRQLPC